MMPMAQAQAGGQVPMTMTMQSPAPGPSPMMFPSTQQPPIVQHHAVQAGPNPMMQSMPTPTMQPSPLTVQPGMPPISMGSTLPVLPPGTGQWWAAAGSGYSPPNPPAMADMGTVPGGMAYAAVAAPQQQRMTQMQMSVIGGDASDAGRRGRRRSRERRRRNTTRSRSQSRGFTSSSPSCSPLTERKKEDGAWRHHHQQQLPLHGRQQSVRHARRRSA